MNSPRRQQTRLNDTDNKMMTQSMLDDCILPGYLMRVRDPRVTPEITIYMRDLVNENALEKAVNQTLSRYPYYRSIIIWNGNVPSYSVCNQVYRLGSGFENTDGAQFQISCVDRRIILLFDHAITDGTGIWRFLREIIASYCNDRYHAAITEAYLGSDPMFSLSELQQYCRTSQTSPRGGSSIPVNDSALMPPAYVQLTVDRESWIRKAGEYAVRPVVLMEQLLSYAYLWCNSTKEVTCAMPRDMRSYIGVPQALYYCVANPYVQICNAADLQFEEFVHHTEDDIASLLSRESAMQSFADWMDLTCKVAEMDRSLAFKRRILNMIDTKRVSDTVICSYLGHIWGNNESLLMSYISDVAIKMIGDRSECIAEMFSMGERLIITMSYRRDGRMYFAYLRELLQEQNITVLDMHMLNGEEDE